MWEEYKIHRAEVVQQSYDYQSSNKCPKLSIHLEFTAKVEGKSS